LATLANGQNRVGFILGWNLQKNLKSDARELENLIKLTEENTEEAITKNVWRPGLRE